MEYPGVESTFLARPFELAHFLHGDEMLARQIAFETLTRLEVTAGRHEKRFYRPLKKRANKVVWSKFHLLQYLVYVESERHERLRQARGAFEDEDLIVWYVEYLVRLSIEHHLLYVVIAIGRFLYRYTCGTGSVHWWKPVGEPMAKSCF